MDFSEDAFAIVWFDQVLWTVSVLCASGLTVCCVGRRIIGQSWHYLLKSIDIALQCQWVVGLWSLPGEHKSILFYRLPTQLGLGSFIQYQLLYFTNLLLPTTGDFIWMNLISFTYHYYWIYYGLFAFNFFNWSFCFKISIYRSVDWILLPFLNSYLILNIDLWKPISWCKKCFDIKILF